MRRAGIIALGLACSLLGLPACGTGNAEALPANMIDVRLDEVVQRTNATGRIVPREEVFVRSLVAGQLVELRVRPGDVVKAGTHIATIRIVADPVMLGEARSQVQIAEAKLARASREHARLAGLKTGTSLSAKEAAQAEYDESIAGTELTAAKERMRLIAEGVANPGAGRSTRVVATISGTVLATPVAVGDFVSEMNSYRDGTTIAVLADMSKLLFKGLIEEAHVGKLSVGMPAKVRVGALPDTLSHGELRWIAPRASVEMSAGPAQAAGNTQVSVSPLTASTQGVTRFELWVELRDPPGGMRAGYTASAELTLERANQVPVVPESALRFERGKVYARVLGKSGKLEERALSLGVSDGVKVAVRSGLSAGDRIAPYPEEPTP
ncbi:MAG TPA: efflux RND transporter periplasmic adaptor subunit [Polyangiales bacterium]